MMRRRNLYPLGSKRKESRLKDTINIYYQTPEIIIYNGDFLKASYIEENSIDLIITSPPYNVDIGYNFYDDKISYEDYLNFTAEWLKRCYAY